MKVETERVYKRQLKSVLSLLLILIIQIQIQIYLNNKGLKATYRLQKQ